MLHLMHLVVHELHIHGHLLHKLQILLVSVEACHTWMLTKVAHEKIEFLLAWGSYAWWSIRIDIHSSTTSSYVLTYETVSTFFEYYIGLFVSELQRCWHELRIHKVQRVNRKILIIALYCTLNFLPFIFRVWGEIRRWKVVVGYLHLLRRLVRRTDSFGELVLGAVRYTERARRLQGAGISLPLCFSLASEISIARGSLCHARLHRLTARSAQCIITGVTGDREYHRIVPTSDRVIC